MEHIIIKITKTDNTNTSLEKEVFSYIKQVINKDWRNLDVEIVETASGGFFSVEESEIITDKVIKNFIS